MPIVCLMGINMRVKVNDVARVPQRLISRGAATRVASIADRRGLDQAAVFVILTMQGHGRKSLALIATLRGMK